MIPGHCRHRRGERSLGHHPDRRQLHQYSEGSDVGQERLRQHRQVPAISAHSQRGSGHRGIRRGMRHRSKQSHMF